jgi:hypothetical protein
MNIPHAGHWAKSKKATRRERVMRLQNAASRIVKTVEGMMQRRDFLRTGVAAVLASSDFSLAQTRSGLAPTFTTHNADWQRVYDRALEVLAANVMVMPPHPYGRFDGPVLIEGAEYAGMWLECGPLESLVYQHWNREAARNNHLTFFALQRPDGQFPSNNKKTEAGYGQIQMVVPVGATAWELADATGDDELLDKAYDACARWDAWLAKYRNTRGTGLCEGFCTYDTGHDNSPRWKGIPNRCPDSDAKRFPPGLGLPRLCPDLSATVYGGRIALGKMARALGKSGEAARWDESAETMRKLIVDKLYVPEDGAFYDLDADNKFVKVRGDLISRVCGEHVVSQAEFANIWTKQLHNPAAFWSTYPLPSIAMDDATFVRPIPRNSWGGASQALTALRAPRWMEHYGKTVELGQMMEAWAKALIADGTFRQQCDPMTGVFTDGGSKGYSPAALVLVDYTWRLAGVRETAEGLEWNVRPGVWASDGARFSVATKAGSAEMVYDGEGARLRLGGRLVATVVGRGRIVTDRLGKRWEVVGTDEREQTVKIMRPGKRVAMVKIRANERTRIPA